MANPFMGETKNLSNLDKERVVHLGVAEKIVARSEKGNEQFDEFTESLASGSESKFKTL